MTYTNEVTRLPNGGWDERILLFANGELVTTAIVVTDRYVVFVDTQMNPATGRVLVEAARPFVTDERRPLVVNTHADFDHAWGNQLFVGADADMPAEILATEASAAIYQRTDFLEFVEEKKRDHPEFFGDLVPTPPTGVLRDGDVIEGGDLTLEVVLTPGHTDDHLSLYIREIDTLLVGDAAELPFPMPCAGSSTLAPLRRSLERLAALRASTVLYCHAPIGVGPDLIHENRAYFHALEVRCREAGTPPPDIDDVVARVGCPVDEVLPATADWRGAASDEQHAHLVRVMLAWLRAARD